MASALRPTSTDSASRRAGFTIMELMIVLAIVGIMAMTIAPSLTEVLTNNRQSSAAMDLVKFGRNARTRAVSSGQAQLVRYLEGLSGGHGRFDVYPGANNKCLQSPWGQAISDGPKRALAFDMLTYNHGPNPKVDDYGRPVLRLIVKTGPVLDELRLCYQPDGLVYAMFGSIDSLHVQDLDVEVTIRRTINGVIHGTDRKVVFPMGGNVRLQ